MVQSDSGAGNDLQVLCRRDGFGINLGSRADENGIDIGDGFEQLGAVRSVGLTNFKVGTECRDGCRRELFGQKYDWFVVRHGCGTFAISLGWWLAWRPRQEIPVNQTNPSDALIRLEFLHVTHRMAHFVKIFTSD